jgi:hypothetical protein
MEPPDFPGAEDIIGWFGYWPSFHDSEVISITLERPGICRVVVKTFEMTREINADGSYKLAKHAVVTFLLEHFPIDRSSGLTPVRIEGFNHQNMLNGIVVTKNPTGYELMLEPVFGVDATIAATRLRAELKPGIDPAPNPKS